MGKKSKKKSHGGGTKIVPVSVGAVGAGANANTRDTAGAARIGDDEGARVQGSFRVPNPTGYTTLVETGGTHHLGGRITHVGSAALPLGQKLVLGRNDNTAAFAFGERQRDSLLGMRDAFYRQFEEIEAEPMDEAALKLEIDFTINRGGDFAKASINETAIMSSQRWFIVALPMDVIWQVILVARIYREIMKEHIPLIEIGAMPNAYLVFAKEIPGATAQNRPDIIAFLNCLFQAPEPVNCFVYSEPSKEINFIWRNFVRSPNSRTLKELPMDANSDDIIDYCHNGAGMMDLTCCFWCEKTNLSCRQLKECQQCRKVSYCSKECQGFDWSAYHKKECKVIHRGEKSAQDLGLKESRLATIKGKDQAAIFPIPIAPPHDTSHVFHGDQMRLHLIHLNKHTMGLDDKTMGFPRGFHIYPQEYFGGT